MIFFPNTDGTAEKIDRDLNRELPERNSEPGADGLFMSGDTAGLLLPSHDQDLEGGTTKRMDPVNDCVFFHWASARCQSER